MKLEKATLPKFRDDLATLLKRLKGGKMNSATKELAERLRWPALDLYMAVAVDDQARIRPVKA